MNKYRAKPTWVDNVRFASKKEAGRYVVLKFLLQEGKIHNLLLHQTHKLKVNGHLICSYVSDFEYELDGVHVIEDTKGVRTPVYKLKKKLMLACLGLTITEV